MTTQPTALPLLPDFVKRILSVSFAEVLRNKSKYRQTQKQINVIESPLLIFKNNYLIFRCLKCISCFILYQGVNSFFLKTFFTTGFDLLPPDNVVTPKKIENFLKIDLHCL